MKNVVLSCCILLAACAGAHSATPSPTVVAPPQPPAPPPDPFADLPVSLYVPPGWVATQAEHPETGTIAFLQYEATGAFVAVILVPNDGNLDTDTVASMFWLTLLQQGFRPTHAPEYESNEGVASIAFAGLTMEGVIGEGVIIARSDRNRPDVILLFVAEWSAGHLSEMLPRIRAISINTRLR